MGSLPPYVPVGDPPAPEWRELKDFVRGMLRLAEIGHMPEYAARALIVSRAVLQTDNCSDPDMAREMWRYTVQHALRVVETLDALDTPWYQVVPMPNTPEGA